MRDWSNSTSAVPGRGGLTIADCNNGLQSEGVGKKRWQPVGAIWQITVEPRPKSLGVTPA
jgi:hypothetical protein